MGDPADGDLFLKMIGLIQDHHVAPPVPCAQPQCKKVPATGHCSTHVPRCVDKRLDGSSCQTLPIRCDDHNYKCSVPGCRQKPTRCSAHRNSQPNNFEQFSFSSK